MVLVVNYVSDLGENFFYDVQFGNLGELTLSQILPPELYELYQDIPGFRGCRTRNIRPRRTVLGFPDTQSFVEIPITPTIEQLRQIRINAGAITVQLVGERIKWNRLKFIADINGG